jgi:hypothetical protein
MTIEDKRREGHERALRLTIVNMARRVSTDSERADGSAIIEQLTQGMPPESKQPLMALWANLTKPVN